MFVPATTESGEVFQAGEVTIGLLGTGSRFISGSGN